MRQLAFFLLALVPLTGCRTTEMATELSDEELIEASLATMDDTERAIARTKMEGLVADGLYDPENENGLAVGDEAPDFSLTPLRFYPLEIDTDRSSKDAAASLYEPIRLSSFRGKMPVVLIFGSYT
jgi:hypothetical protein